MQKTYVSNKHFCTGEILSEIKARLSSQNSGVWSDFSLAVRVGYMLVYAQMLYISPRKLHLHNAIKTARRGVT